MKKRLIVITIEPNARDNYLRTLREFFQDSIELVGYAINGQELPAYLDCDLILYTSQELVSAVRPRIRETTNILLLRRVLLQKTLKQLEDYPQGTSALLFDYSVDTAKYIISQILDCGFRNINFTPLGRDSAPETLEKAMRSGTELLVIVGLGDLVTIHMPQVIDLGWAAIDPNQLLEMSILLHCFTDQMEKRLLQYIRLTSNTNHGILYFLRTIMESQSRYQTVVELLEEGVLVYRKNGDVVHCNDALAALFHLEKKRVAGANLRELPIPKPLKEDLLALRPVEDKWLSGGSSRSSFTLSVYEIGALSQIVDYVAVIRSSERVQRRSSQIRHHLKTQGFSARYTFENIQGDSPAITHCRELGRHIARADGPVLITGETGTGKELFAQAIHNASPRRKMPFVALNCAALTPTLLESELFGYEAGAFTGSKAEGHIGLFECAHEGTIFLDEIGELPMELQAKLLRVLEEHEVRPVGSHRIVPINVRIIAATNQDLCRLMEEKRFRADLYYRLSLFPLELPPLRERPEDIPLLARHFLSKLRSDMRMTDRLLEMLQRLPWKGNVRELRNYIEYMASIDSRILDVDDLPPQAVMPRRQRQEDGAAAQANGLVMNRADRRVAEALLVLLRERPMGRTALRGTLIRSGEQVSEYHIRRVLAWLREEGLLTYGAGRGGISLTKKGLLLAEKAAWPANK